MKSGIYVYPVFKKLLIRGSKCLFHFIRKNHFQTKLAKFVYKPVIENKEKELLHQQLIADLQKCKTVEEQIKVFSSLVKLPEENIKQRHTICKDLEKVLRPYFPSCSVHLIGSSVNDLGFKGCDVDLSVQFLDENAHKASTTKKEEVLKLKSLDYKVLPSKNQLLTIRKILQDSKYDDPLTVIPGRCPILSFTALNLPCDLSINNSSALNSTNLMLLCGKLDERVVPFIQIIIYWAKKSRLVGGHSKFKTYSIFLLVLYFLQTRNPPVLPSIETIFEKTEFLKNLENWSYNVKLYLNKFEKSKNNQTIEELLKEFFPFYGNYDFSYIICPMNGTLMDKKSFASLFDRDNAFEHNTICIQDPFNLKFNVTTGVNWAVCKNFLKAIIAVWEKYQDQNIWIPGPHQWGLVSLINSQFKYDNIRDIKEFSIDLSLRETTIDNSTEKNSIDVLQEAADKLKYILSHCLLFQCRTFNHDSNIDLLELPAKVKSSIENLFFKTDALQPENNVILPMDDTNTIAQYICTTQDTWSGRNTFITFVNSSKNIFDVEHTVSEKMVTERGINEKEEFYFLCQLSSVSVNNKTHLHVRLIPLNNNRFIPKLAVFLKDYIPYLMKKSNHEL